MTMYQKEKEAFEKIAQEYKVPKQAQKLVLRRTMLSRKLRQAITDVDSYCESIGLDALHPLFQDAVLATDVRIFCEEDAGHISTLEAIEKVLAEKKGGAE